MILKLDFVSSLKQILKLNVASYIYVQKATKFVWCLKSNNYHIYKDPESKYKAKKKAHKSAEISNVCLGH